jgi:hypothetical protein
VFPSVGDVVVGTDNSIWVSMLRRGANAGRWLAFYADGRIYGELQLPPNARLAQASISHLRTIESDSLGFESLNLYRVQQANP